MQKNGGGNMNNENLVRYLLVVKIDINNCISGIFKKIKGLKYAIWQLEKGTYDNHIQMYVELENEAVLEEIKSEIEVLYIEQAGDKREACIAYCSKEGCRLSGPYEVFN